MANVLACDGQGRLALNFVWPTSGPVTYIGGLQAQVNVFRSAIAAEVQNLNYILYYSWADDLLIRVPRDQVDRDWTSELESLLTNLRDENVVIHIWRRPQALAAIARITWCRRLLRCATKFVHLFFSLAGVPRILSLFVVERDWYLHHTAHPPATLCKAMNGLAMSRVCPAPSIAA